MNDQTIRVTGGCYCGKVRYRARLTSPEITECHCSQCRKQAGHRYAAANAVSDDVEIEGGDGLTWFRASPDAERGFCAACGSHLFWKMSNGKDMAILAASIEGTPSLRLAQHIFVESKGGYYEITDGLPQFVGYDEPAPDQT